MSDQNIRDGMVLTTRRRTFRRIVPDPACGFAPRIHVGLASASAIFRHSKIANPIKSPRSPPLREKLHHRPLKRRLKRRRIMILLAIRPPRPPARSKPSAGGAGIGGATPNFSLNIAKFRSIAPPRPLEIPIVPQRIQPIKATLVIS